MTKSVWLGLLVSGAALLCSGCISRTTKVTYPDSWSPVAAVPATQCPRLAGRYSNTGEVAPAQHPSDEHHSCSHPYRAEWCGETALSQNIGNFPSPEWVELRQPDEDTLLVVSSDPTVPVKELHQKKGDFSCSAQGLERSVHGSSMGVGNNADETSVGLDVFSAMATAFNAASAGAGGVRSLTRRFSTAADGSLVMAMSESDRGVLLLIPYHLHDEAFVRWTPVAQAPTAAVPAAQEASAVPPSQLPAAGVGIFDATNGHMWSKVKVTNLDGASLNTYAGLQGVPVAMVPGRHWVQVAAHATHLIPLRDLDTTYAFQMEAVAGHRYRVPQKPATCLAPGDVDAALASGSVYHTRLSVIDEAPGASGQSFEVEALCVSARTYVCEASPTGGGADPDGKQCVRLEGWSHGYFGKDAGPVPAQ